MLYVVRFLIFLSSIWSYCIFNLKYLLGKTSTNESLQEYVKSCEGLSTIDLQNKIRTDFTYESDFIDYAKHELDFFFSRRGDCDDHAHFCEVVLPRLGFTMVSTVSVMKPDKHGHAICIAEKDGKWYGFGNWQLVHFMNNDLEHIGNEVCKRMDGGLWFAVRYQNGEFIEGIIK